VRILDLFCGAGGAAMGYHRAFPDAEIVGVDLHPQPRYPFSFVQADAMTFDLDGFDFIHASPPCQSFSFASLFHAGTQDKYPDLIDPTRQRLLAAGVPHVIENVPGAPIRQDVLLCGEMFGLRVHRHRYFEVHGFLVMQAPHSKHNLRGADHNCHIEEGVTRIVAGHFSDLADAGDAMGIDWMNHRELAESIPPAYTEHIGLALAAHLQEAEAA
jgi:DNA (cytosine-5)-methyltransferase 1